MANGSPDHVVIDVVASLFDQILSDPGAAANGAPAWPAAAAVLRVALGDETFFSSRRHPVRLFVNRLASLACAFDDFSHDPGKSFPACATSCRPSPPATSTASTSHRAARPARRLHRRADARTAHDREHRRRRAGGAQRDRPAPAAALCPPAAAVAHQRQDAGLPAPVPGRCLEPGGDAVGPRRQCRNATRMRQLGRSLVMSVQPRARRPSGLPARAAQPDARPE